MVVVRPFEGIRPAKDLADKVACLPYDVLKQKPWLQTILIAFSISTRQKSTYRKDCHLIIRRSTKRLQLIYKLF